jgi:class 3 adenylate cyclase
MQNLVPQFILEKYTHGESGGSFQSASLFADISGFSAATHALMKHGGEAAEAMADIMLSIFGPLVEQIHARGGFITTFAGDAFTALFPIEGEDDGCLRALAAAHAIQHHLIAHPVQITPYGSFPFAIKLGLGEGQVEWGILSSEKNETGPAEQNAIYFFSGPAVISAAAAEHQSQSGTLVLSPGMYARVQASVKALALADGYWRCLGLQGDLLPISTRPEPVVMPDVEALFIPEAIRQRETHGDFRQVVSVFLQLQGMETRQDLDIFMQAVFDLLHQFDGYLNRLDFGDKGCNLLLFWGMPTSHENDVQRALEFVLELGNHTPGSFRAGLTYCPMYAGLSGSDARGEFTCYGDGINLAARLMSAAPWGSLWMDEHLAGRARAQYVTEYVDHLPFKGFAEKQPVHALIERRPPGENFFEGRLVGRQIELAELSAFVQPLFAPVGARRFAGILALVGDAGLGKSRLLYKFLTDDHGPVTGKAQVFTCQVDQVLRQPLNPFRYWLQRYFDQSPAQSSERNKRAFSRKFERLLGTVSDLPLAQELNRTRSCLGALVGLEWESSLYARLTPQGRYENTLQALKALLKAESLRQPVLLVLEDAHWLDEDSQAFVQLLAREIETFPLAVIATARPEREGALFGASLSYHQVELAGFSLDELAALAADRLGGHPLPPCLNCWRNVPGTILFSPSRYCSTCASWGGWRRPMGNGDWQQAARKRHYRTRCGQFSSLAWTVWRRISRMWFRRRLCWGASSKCASWLRCCPPGRFPRSNNG